MLTISGLETQWTPTSITAPVPPGATSGPVVVWTAAQPSNGVGVTVVMGPEIHRLGPTWGPAGTPVVISGVNFGATQGSSTVTFNGVVAATTAWSDTSVTATVPGGTTSGLVVVTRGTASPGGAVHRGHGGGVYYTTDGIGSERQVRLGQSTLRELESYPGLLP